MRTHLSARSMPVPVALALALLAAWQSPCEAGLWHWQKTTTTGPVVPVAPVYGTPMMAAAPAGWPTTSATPPAYSGPVAPTYPLYGYPGYTPGYPSYAYPGYTYPANSAPTYSYPSYSYPGYAYPGYSVPSAPPQTASPGAPLSYLADFDSNTAPIVGQVPGATPAFGGLVGLGVQILGDLATQWFSGAATDRNGLLQIAQDIFRRRANLPANQPISGLDLSKLGQMVDRIIANITRGGNVASGGPAGSPPSPSQPATNVLTFTVTAPLNSGVSGVGLQYGAAPPATAPPPPPPPPATGNQPAGNPPPPVNRTTPSGGPGNP